MPDPVGVPKLEGLAEAERLLGDPELPGWPAETVAWDELAVCLAWDDALGWEGELQLTNIPDSRSPQPKPIPETMNGDRQRPTGHLSALEAPVAGLSTLLPLLLTGHD